MQNFTSVTYRESCGKISKYLSIFTATFFTRPDRDNIAVALDRMDYIVKMEQNLFLIFLPTHIRYFNAILLN